MKSARPARATQKGLAFIRHEQQTDGGFASLSSPSQTSFESTKTYQTTFAPALMLAALNTVEQITAKRICKRLAAWLVAQKSPGGSFNYWAMGALQRETLPYPDDLDDTTCALAALRQYDPALVDEACLAKVVKLLLAAESAVGGPYRTWLVAADAPAVWQDVDLAVNSNVNYFLSLVAEPLPNVTKLVERAIRDQRFASPYYPSPYPIFYYIARWYRGKYTPELAKYIIGQQKKGWWGSPLQTALAVSSLVRLGQAKHCKTAVDLLLDQQQSDGSWPAEAFCLDPEINGQTYYSGSATLTTAFVLEAIQVYQRATSATPSSTKVAPAVAQPVRQQIIDAAFSICEAQSSALRRQSRLTLQQTLRRDHANYDEIVLFPHLFNQSLIRPLADSQQKIFMHLGLANLFGWAAYTIYDDFLDDEGRPSQLSVANMALRHCLDQFGKALPDEKAYATLVQSTFDSIDGANAWELAHCRMAVSKQAITVTAPPVYPSSLYLADRSLGHALAPFGVLAASGVAPQDRRTLAIHRSLRHYIAARQLNDDLHDWEQDLRAGRISYVVAAIMHEMDLPPGRHDFSQLIPNMQRQFWHQTLPAMCQIILRHTRQARQAAKTSHLLTKNNILTQITSNIEKSVAQTLSEQTKAEKFLSAYQTQ